VAVSRILQSLSSGGEESDDELLHGATRLAIPEDDDTITTVVDLLDTKTHHRSLCVGLAAPQIGSNLRIAIVQHGEDDIVMINPEIISTSGKKDTKRESCMSIWGMVGPVERRDKVEVSFIDGEGIEHLEKYTGFTARIVQHELDHLDGVLFDQRANDRLAATDIFEGRTPASPE